MILVSVKIIRSKQLICTACMACANLGPLLSWMLRVPRDSPRGCDVQWCDVGGSVLRRSPPWLIGWVRQIGTLVGFHKNIYGIGLSSFYGQYGSIALRRYPLYQAMAVLLDPAVSVVNGL